MDDDDLSGLVAVRMGIFLGRTSVRRPSGVPDTVISVKRAEPDAFFQIPQLALGTPKLEVIVIVNNGDSRRIVTAVFELSEAVNNKRHDLFISYVSNNSTHNFALNRVIDLVN
jgi:hypothetical protein